MRRGLLISTHRGLSQTFLCCLRENNFCVSLRGLRGNFLRESAPSAGEQFLRRLLFDLNDVVVLLALLQKDVLSVDEAVGVGDKRLVHFRFVDGDAVAFQLAAGITLG